MNVYKRLAVAALALPLMLGSVSAVAYANNHNGCNGKMKMKMGHMLRGIDLTPAQETQLNALHTKHQEEKMNHKNNFKAQSKANHEEMTNLLLAGTYNESQVQALAQKMSNEQVEKRVNSMNRKREVIDILTPDQKAQMKEKMDKMTSCNMMRGEMHKNKGMNKHH